MKKVRERADARNRGRAAAISSITVPDQFRQELAAVLTQEQGSGPVPACRLHGAEQRRGLEMHTPSDGKRKGRGGGTPSPAL